ncbi:trypsin-like peptidase domain-containing protein [Streptomyces sp. NPDC058145]|uniref:VMAP-C domain-containing protein n=1 Tax=Streptomyces sp. NPDC058145 TaxID=3346356 RepID=UPI0036EA96F2
MRGHAWHARIECGGSVLGAGFLVAPNTVLTCAHVVAGGSAGLTVSFPGRRDLAGVPATVAVHGGWAGGDTDPGDLAVLELADRVPLSPAGFAPPGAEQGLPAPSLEAYGFPEGYDGDGQIAEYRAVSAQRIADEWVQLEAVTGHGQPLRHGFSGAAVTLKDGRVVGMVAQMAAEPDVRVARMLPTEVMARYWPALGELVPALADGPDPVRRLYALVRRAEAEGLECRPDQLFVDAVGDFGPEPPPGGFPSLPAAVGYVQWEVPEPAEALTRFADRLTELLDGPVAPTAPAGPDPDQAGWAPILVEIDRSGAGQDQVTVAVSAYREGRRRPVGTVRLTRAEVQRYVQRGIDEAFTHLAPDAEELLTFVLPRDWLDLPVAHWACSADDPTPLGCAHPVVVTEGARHRSNRLRHRLGKKWQRLSAGSATAVHRVDCGTREHPFGLRKRLRETGADLAVFAGPPSAVPEYFEVGLNMPVPILLWSRSGCPDGAGHRAPCAGSAFLDALITSLEGVPPAELPGHIQTLREDALADDEPERHWARDIQLLWDDPRCFPGPTASLHSPVA